MATSGSSSYDYFFKEADKDGSGYLTYDELRKVLRKNGYKGKDKDIKKYFKQLDTSKDKKVSYEEYMTAMNSMADTEHQTATFRKVFLSFDKDNSGEIDARELKQVLAQFGRSYSDQELQKMISNIDRNGSGTVDYEEFMSLFM